MQGGLAIAAFKCHIRGVAGLTASKEVSPGRVNENQQAVFGPIIRLLLSPTTQPRGDVLTPRPSARGVRKTPGTIRPIESLFFDHFC
jgi:hypothetical protein